MLSLPGRIVLAVAAMLSLTSCGYTLRPESAPKPEALPRLLSPWLPTGEYSIYQQITALNGDNQYYFESAVEFSQEELHLVLLSDLGRRLATIKYNGINITVDKSRFLPKAFDPSHVLEAIQMTYWPTEAFAGQATPGWYLDASSNSMDRRFYYREKLIVEVEYDDACPYKGTVNYHHRVYDFHLQINSVVIANANSGGTGKHDELCTLR